MKPFQQKMLTAVSRLIGRKLRVPATTVRRYLTGEAEPAEFLKKEVLGKLK